MQHTTIRTAAAGLCLALCLGLVVAPPHAGTNFDDLVQKANTFTGASQGSWNSPAFGSDGFAFGTWSPVVGGPPLFMMSVQLEATSPDEQSGFLTGTLESFPLSPLGNPWAAVNGTWEIADPVTGRGSFAGYVTTYLPNPLMGAPIQLLGQFQGRFVDQTPVTPHAPDSLGQYRLRWELF